MTGTSPAPAGPGPGRRALLVAYDGSAYSGWQRQPDRPTVQGVLEDALKALLGEPVRVFGAGRTDAGVHAFGQVAHFDDPLGRLPPGRIAAALDPRLPVDVRVRACVAVPAGFHARHDAVRKTYAYHLHAGAGFVGSPAEGHPRPGGLPPHRRAQFHLVQFPLDVAAMRAAAARLVGTHDFTAVSRTMEPGRQTTRTLLSLRVLRLPRGLRVVAVGDGFLYGMVRMLSGLLVEVGRGRIAPDEVDALLAARDRSRSPPMLPPQGLFLARVRYAAAGRDGEPFPLLS